MKRHTQIIAAVAALVVISVSPSLGVAADRSLAPSRSDKITPCNKNNCESAVFANLFLQFMTRPGLISTNDVHLMRPAAQEAALSFQLSVEDATKGVKWTPFAKKVNELLDIYATEYGLVPEGVTVAEARGGAVDRLHEGLLLAASQSRIPGDAFHLAILRGVAKAEAVVERGTSPTGITATSRELVRLLSRYAVDDIQWRIGLDAIRGALVSIRAPEEITGPYGEIYSALRPLRWMWIWLEEFLADPANINDQRMLIIEQFNHEVEYDLLASKYGMELYFAGGHALDGLLQSFAARMPGMSVERLEELGLLPVFLTEAAAYYSVTADMRLSYSPVAGLSEKLIALGVTPPAPPDFTLFPNPFRALFQLHYDITLCDQITGSEWGRAEDAALDRPLSLGEKLVLAEAKQARLSQVSNNGGGVQKDTVKALMLLLQSAINLRI